MKYRKRDTRRERRLWYVVMAAVAVVFLVLGIVGAAWLYSLRRESEEKIAERAYAQTAGSVLFQNETVEYKGRTYRRNSHVKAILCMGVDRKGSMGETTVATFGGQADGVFLIAQDTARNALDILMIPRDTMTEITLTDLSGNVLGKDVQHLTLAYAYGDGREGSCQQMERAVSELLGGLKIDHYMAANIEVINILNNSIGGVTVTVPSDGMEKKDPAFVKGAKVTLQGEQAEAFVRYRDTKEAHSAVYRMARQQEYMTRFFGTVKEKAARDSGIVTRLLQQIEEYMVTDMGKEEYLKIAMDALSIGELDPKDIHVAPGQAVMTGVYDEFYIDQEALTKIVLELFFREAS